MGAGRKTQTINVDARIPAFESGHTFARNLRKSDLGGVIFGCKHNTMQECLSKQLFGLPSAHFSYVRNIEPGLPLFNFNYSDRKIHGVYEAASHGQMHIDAYAWSDGGAERSAFPAQVRIRIREHCNPLSEKEFKNVIEDNYYTLHHFWFELDHTQTRCLIALFKLRSPTLGSALNQFSPADPFLPLPVPKRKSMKVLKANNSGNENKFAFHSLDCRDSGYAHSNAATFNAAKEVYYKEPTSNFKGFSLDGASSSIGVDFNEGSENLDKRPLDVEDYENVLLKLENLSTNFKLNSSSGAINEGASLCAQEDLDNHSMQLFLDSFNSVNNEKIESGTGISDVGKVLSESCSLAINVKDSTSADISHGTVEEGIRELKERTAALERQKVESDAEIQNLQNLNRNLGRMVQLLSARLTALETKIGTSMLVEGCLDKFSNQDLAQEDLIYIIGGYSGSAWLSTLDSFSPSLDILTPLKSMRYARSYASAAVLNGVIYVLGGGDGSSWYDTVECYDRRLDEWTCCPSMIREKGSLACATLNGKIYAIGGGDGSESFSDVEMFDPALCRWISWQSMAHKRFAPAAAELNGVLFAVGGYDGQNYLKSAERLDPREVSCKRIPDMISRRGCHSLTVLNEKLFVMGGYDGENMISNVEIYDPRANAWMPNEPMKCCRGYAASALVGNSLFIIGGIEDSETIVETIEYYKEGNGWNNSRLKAVGKRCFFSAVVL